MTPERIAEIREAAESFSGLQYVVTHSKIQWPWTSSTATNQVVDLVRAIPALLDELVAEREARTTLSAAVEAVSTPHPDGGPCWCPGDWPWNDETVHASACANLRALLAQQPGE